MAGAQPLEPMRAAPEGVHKEQGGIQSGAGIWTQDPQYYMQVFQAVFHSLLQDTDS